MIAAARARLVPWNPPCSIAASSSGTVTSRPRAALKSIPRTVCQPAGTGSDGFSTAAADTAGRSPGRSCAVRGGEGEGEDEDEDEDEDSGEGGDCGRAGGEGGGKAVSVAADVSSGVVDMVGFVVWRE